MGEHRTSVGKQGKDLQALRRKLKQEREGQVTIERPKRENRNQDSKNEDHLQRDLLKAIATIEKEERATNRLELGLIADALGFDQSDFPTEALSRVSKYSHASMLEAHTTHYQARSTFHRIMEEVARRLTTDEDAAKYLMDISVDHEFLRRNKSWNNASVDNLIDVFVRTLRNPMRERSIFAILVNITKGKDYRISLKLVYNVL